MAQEKKNPLSSCQVRAARALVSWSQEELATKSGLSITTIRKIELGHISPREKTDDLLRHAFEDSGLDFLPSNGVRQKPEDVTIYQGAEGTIAFFDDVYQTALVKSDDIVVVCQSEEPFAKVLGDYITVHLSRMMAIKNLTKVKCILTENFQSRPASYCEYRALPRGYIDSVPFYVYGNKYAIFFFESEPSPKIIVLDSPMIATAYRRQFYSIWDKAMPLSET